MRSKDKPELISLTATLVQLLMELRGAGKSFSWQVRRQVEKSWTQDFATAPDCDVQPRLVIAQLFMHGPNSPVTSLSAGRVIIISWGPQTGVAAARLINMLTAYRYFIMAVLV